MVTLYNYWVAAAIKVSTRAPIVLSYCLHFYHHLYCISLLLNPCSNPLLHLHLGKLFQNLLCDSSVTWEGYYEFLTIDIEVNCIMGVCNAIHDLTAISARITGTKLDHCQWGIANILGVTGHWHAVPVAGAYLDDPILCHQHCGFYFSLYFGPFDP